MNEFRTSHPRRFPFRGRPRLIPASTLCAVVVLGLSGWAHFTGQSRDEAPTSTSEQATPVLPGEEFPLSPIHHTLDETTGGRVVTASATSSDAIASHAEDDAGTQESAPLSRDQRLRLAILGKWEDEYRGKRHLAVRDDGTGTMVVEPDGLGKRLFAAELRFELEWSLENGRVTMTMVRGEPKAKVQLILKLHGQEADYKILELTGDQMLLLDPDGKTRYDWRRPGATADSTK